MSRRLSPDDWLDDQDLYKACINLGIDNADAIIVSDGSGTGWNRSCGWAAVIFDTHTKHKKVLQGAMSFGTSYLAELMPYVHALSWYVEGPGRHLLADRLKVSAHNRVIIHAITDNQTVAKQGQGKIGRGTGDYYWAMFDCIEENGYEVHWHWMERDTLGLNRVADHLAGLCRKGIEAVEGIPSPGVNDKIKEVTDVAKATNG